MCKSFAILLLCGVVGIAQQSGRYRPCSATETTQCVPTIDASGNIVIGTPASVAGAPRGSINFGGNLYQNGVLFSGGGGGGIGGSGTMNQMAYFSGGSTLASTPGMTLGGTGYTYTPDGPVLTDAGGCALYMAHAGSAPLAEDALMYDCKNSTALYHSSFYMVDKNGHVADFSSYTALGNPYDQLGWFLEGNAWIPPANIDQAGATNGQALVWSASAGKWVPGSVSGGGGGTGTVTKIVHTFPTAGANYDVSYALWINSGSGYHTSCPYGTAAFPPTGLDRACHISGYEENPNSTNWMGFYDIVPSSWTSGAVTVTIVFANEQSGARFTQYRMATSCTTNGNSWGTYNAVQTFAGSYATQGSIFTNTLAATMTGCAASSLISFVFARADANGTADMYEASVEYTIP